MSASTATLGGFLAAIQSGAVAKGSVLICENADWLSRQGAKIGRKLLEKIVDEGVDVHIVNMSKKLTYGWENRQEDSIVVDAELGRAFKESQRKSVIREIFRLAANGLGSKRIMQDLNSRGFKCGISVGTVGHLLRDRAVLGEHQPLQYLETGLSRTVTRFSNSHASLTRSSSTSWPQG
jgi:hypothetical protein